MSDNEWKDAEIKTYAKTTLEVGVMVSGAEKQEVMVAIRTTDDEGEEEETVCSIEASEALLVAQSLQQAAAAVVEANYDGTDTVH